MTDRVSGAGYADDADVMMLWQATARAEVLLDDLVADRPVDTDLTALLDYLREVVLARISEEENRLVAADAAGRSSSDLDRLRKDHLMLTEDVDALASLAAPHGSRDPQQLGELVRRLITRLERHLRAEAAALSVLAGGDRSGSAGWMTAHRWYLLTEGDVIDLDQLLPEQADDAVLNRLSHLRAGEEVELHGHGDTRSLWRRLQQRSPGDFSWSEREAGAHGRVVVVARRSAG